MQTDKDARELAKRVAQESSGVKIKFGNVNGRPVLHIVNENIEDRRVRSNDIRNVAEWIEHPWNRTTQRKRNADLDAGVEAAA